MDLLDRARKSLSKSLNDNNSIRAQSYALDSIAASLLHIAENTPEKPNVDMDEVRELTRRVDRLLDWAKEPTVKTPKAKK